MWSVCAAAGRRTAPLMLCLVVLCAAAVNPYQPQHLPHLAALQVIWSMPPEFHLRLLCALCNDVVNCYNMKAEIAGRCACTGA